jgi:hypothetical protein
MPMTSPDNSSRAPSFLHDAWFHCGNFVRDGTGGLSGALAIVAGTMPIDFCANRSLVSCPQHRLNTILEKSE